MCFLLAVLRRLRLGFEASTCNERNSVLEKVLTDEVTFEEDIASFVLVDFFTWRFSWFGDLRTCDGTRNGVKPVKEDDLGFAFLKTCEGIKEPECS